MRTGSARALFATAAALTLFLLGCPLPNVPGSVATSGTSGTSGATNAAGAAARTLLPGTSTSAALLLLSQSTAFAILGHSCGGIQEKAYATGFDSVSGLPTGDVYIQTRCGGSGRGGGYHTTTYSAWVGATWDFSGNVVSSAKLAPVGARRRTPSRWAACSSKAEAVTAATQRAGSAATGRWARGRNMRAAAPSKSAPAAFLNGPRCAG